MAHDSLPARASSLALADRFFAAIERNDMSAVRAILAPDAVIWHNFDPLAARFDAAGGEALERTLAMLSALPELILEMRYELWREVTTERGFVRQHIVQGRTSRGEAVSIPTCVVVEVSGERITRIDEYLNVGHLPASILEYFARAN